MSKRIAISVQNLHKSFHLPKEHSSELKRTFINFVRGIKGYKEQKVLRGISFDIEEGDFFGIVGRNGSGKSTLLKLLAGIYEPGKGSISVDGSLVPFIELGVGFNPELTGRENIYMNGAMLGFSNEDVDKMYNEIVNFAELHEFMDQKLKNYSSGMQVRLAFSIAIRAESDILLLDEVLAVGDEAFQRKCFAYFAKLRRDKKTVILVTHSMDSVQQFCNKAMLIENGEILEKGKPSVVAQKYRELNMPITKGASGMESKNQNTIGTQKDNIDVKVDFKKDKSKNLLTFDFKINSKIDLKDPLPAFIIIRDTGETVYRWVMNEKTDQIFKLEKNKEVKIHLDIQNIFPDGVFEARFSINKLDRTEDYLIYYRAAEFSIMHKSDSINDVVWKPNATFSIIEE
jgi:ABC-2 type transport system ATP-binding protein